MSGVIDSFLAEMYNTKTASAPSAQEDLEKEASVQLFMKLAGQEGIDLKSMSDKDVMALYDTWQAKVAESGAVEPPVAAPAKTAGVDDAAQATRAVAEKEYEEKRAAAEKAAEADVLGRIMAHAFTDEFRKIAAAGGVPGIEAGAESAKTAGEMPEAFRNAMKGKGEDKGEKKDDDDGKGEKGEKKDAPPPFQKKKASAIDELAAERAVKVAHEGGFNAEQAARKVASVRELELVGESTKVASAASLDDAVGIRALEFLEAAGYPVTWTTPAQQ